MRTDLTPRDTNDCLAVARTLNEQVKKLARQTRRGIPPEFTRVASDLNQSCGAQEFKKAWISIDWMNGCLNNFTKDAELGFCSRNEGYSCALDPQIRRLCAGTMTLFTRTVFLDDVSLLAKLDPGAWPERHGNIECRTSHDEITQASEHFLTSPFRP